MSRKSQDYLKNYQNLLDKKINIMLQSYDPVAPIKKSRRPTPEEVKLRVLQSQRLQRFVDDFSDNKEERQKKMFEALQILSEIAFDRKMIVIRTLGTVVYKLLSQLYTSVLINERSLNNLKSSFGSEQVLYLPSHRSYADFMLMSVICFCYNMEIPAIAAGMDFHGMMGLGEGLRKTGAFFMRRTYGSNDFYWKLFKEYMHSVITFNDQGVEFFVEGTRSRSCKALTPKTGLLSMALEPFFMGEVHDLRVVPVSISYEKPLEEQLFVYELLGIPKPKESTMGFIKAVTNLKNQNLGKIYFDFGEAMSLNEYFGDKLNRFVHASEPAFVQSLNQQELHLTTDLANEVVRRQQQNIVMQSYNFIALIYNEAVFTETVRNLTFWELKQRIFDLVELFEGLGAVVAIDMTNLDKDILDTIAVHHNILEVNGNNSNIKLIKSNVDLSSINATKLKGIRLCNEVMNVSVPVFSLQLYCNPTLYWLAQPAFIVLSLLGKDGNEADIESLREDFDKLRQIFIYEFVLYPEFAAKDFKRSLTNLTTLGVLSKTNDETFQLNNGSKYINLLLSSIAPFINCYLNASKVILNSFKGKDFMEKTIFMEVQTYLEEEMLKGEGNIHPYSLCLDSIMLMILSLCNAGCFFKAKHNTVNHYSFNKDNLSSLVDSLTDFNSKLPFVYKYFDVLSSSKL